MAEQPIQTKARTPGIRFTQAFRLARSLHKKQLRKGTQIPYISHLLAVASLVLEHGGDEDEAIAGLLHDAPEDQGGKATLKLIRSKFGSRVAGIVAGCSDTFEEPKPPWRPRKAKYLKHLPHASRSIQLVGAADKLHNARSILADYRVEGEALWSRFNATREQTLWYYRSVIRALEAGAPSGLVEELERTISALELEIKSRVANPKRPRAASGNLSRGRG